MHDREELQRRCQSVVAELSGEVEIDGLEEPVEVIRDRWGVAHIYAENEHDLFFAQGFVAAQDRLFQMDWWRRMAVGETAAILGSDGLEGDRFARLVRYRGEMDAEWSSYGPRTREIATAFTNGINSYIDLVADRLPIEFQLLNYQPARWRAEDCLGRMSGMIMVRNYQQELWRSRLIAEVGIEQARRLAPADPAHDYAPHSQLDLDAIDPVAILSSFLTATQARFSADDGSNNWVIPGPRSSSGMPLLASDPHRTIGMPSLRYLVHLNAPGWNVIGSGEPTLPGVAAGHNESIAWGFTIICTDQADIFVEETHPDDSALYRVDNNWATMEVETERVEVQGQAATELELRFTRHGPVVYQDEDRNRAYVLRWAGAEPGGAAYLGSLAVNQAQNWEQFREAMKGWKMPSENMVYADREGNTGWIAAALTPVRPASDGMLPTPGADSGNEWLRFLDVDELPQLVNPAEPIITANHNILPDGYEHTIAYEWTPPYRFQRIEEQLQTKKQFNLDDMKLLQHDNMSLPGRRLARLAGDFTCDDDHADELRQEFVNWNGELQRDSRLGVIYGFWLHELLARVFSPHVSQELLPFVAGHSGIPVLLEALEEPTPEWFGDDASSNCSRILRDSFVAALSAAEEALGGNSDEWTWGQLHTVSFTHPLSAMDPACAGVFDRGPCPQAGDGLCPNAARHDLPLPADPAQQFRQVSGASYRHIFDLVDWDLGVATSAPGQSGQPESPHYDDLLELWKKDQYFPLVYSRAAVEREAAHRLRLRSK